MPPPLEDPKHANRWIFGGLGVAVLALLSPNEWYANLGFFWNIYHANIEGTLIPVRTALAVAAVAVLIGLYLRTQNSK